MAKGGSSQGGVKTKRAGPSGAVKTYLIGYNLVQTIGWSYLLYQLVTYYLHPSSKSLYDTVQWTLIVFQNAAVLEVAHAVLKFVPSSPIITAIQVASRVLVVCGILMPTQAARETVGLPLALLAWSITEVIRYGNYTFNLMNAVPYVLVWLRYTTFIALYPIGVTGELLCIYAAQKEVSRTQIFTLDFPNRYNFMFRYQHFLWFLMFLYIPLFPRMYLHMFAQRIKVLGGAQPKKEQ